MQNDTPRCEMLPVPPPLVPNTIQAESQAAKTDSATRRCHVPGLAMARG